MMSLNVLSIEDVCLMHSSVQTLISTTSERVRNGCWNVSNVFILERLRLLFSFAHLMICDFLTTEESDGAISGLVAKQGISIPFISGLNMITTNQ